jgi:hypothetical protein
MNEFSTGHRLTYEKGEQYPVTDISGISRGKGWGVSYFIDVGRRMVRCEPRFIRHWNSLSAQKRWRRDLCNDVYNANVMIFARKSVFCEERGIHFILLSWYEHAPCTIVDFQFTARRTEKYQFPTRSKTELPMQAGQITITQNRS